MTDFKKLSGFEWDKGNLDKSYQKHNITPNETEEIFLDENVKIEEDIKHQEQEQRFIAIGKTTENKILFVVFTVRSNQVRVISGRLANKKEREVYYKKV
ncbi:BrnT family toxin [Candidatus Microgenomates bacterium]|nr:BrnT family toxin [Candidatus Microgenomates bacterium]